MRRHLRPGEMFGVRALGYLDVLMPGLYVVVDRQTEIEFWTGARACLGDIMPGRLVEAL